MKLVRQIRDNKINIIELATKLGRIDRMNSEQTGMFDIPPVTDATLNRLHAMAFCIPRIDDDAYKCTPTVGELFTNQWGEAPDWVLLPRGMAVREGLSRHDQRAAGTTRSHPRRTDGRTDENTRLPIPEGCLISEWMNGQSGDHLSRPMAMD